MKLSHLVKGLPGHPLHPPLTDATIGIYTAAAGFGLLSVLGVSERNTAAAWWLALVAGLVVTGPTALTESITGSTSRGAARGSGARRPSTCSAC